MDFFSLQSDSATEYPTGSTNHSHQASPRTPRSAGAGAGRAGYGASAAAWGFPPPPPPPPPTGLPEVSDVYYLLEED